MQVLILIATAGKEAVAPHYFTLILVPSTLINIWVTEINSCFFSVLNLNLYYKIIDSGGSTDPLCKYYTVNSKNMPEALVKLKKNNPKSSLTVILSAYST